MRSSQTCASLRSSSTRVQPNTIEAMSHFTSAPASPMALQPRSRSKRKENRPTPLPRYRKPASSKGGNESSFASGVVISNRTAAASAATTGARLQSAGAAFTTSWSG